MSAPEKKVVVRKPRKKKVVIANVEVKKDASPYAFIDEASEMAKAAVAVYNLIEPHVLRFFAGPKK